MRRFHARTIGLASAYNIRRPWYFYAYHNKNYTGAYIKFVGNYQVGYQGVYVKGRLLPSETPRSDAKYRAVGGQFYSRVLTKASEEPRPAQFYSGRTAPQLTARRLIALS